MIIWIIGLSASGKTTLAKEVLKSLRATGEPWLFMDGDGLRSILGDDLGHTIEERRKLGQRMVNLSKECDAQSINLLASILSIFPDQRNWLREHVNDYREIVLDVPLEILRKRDNKGLYEKAIAGEIKNVVGVDIPFPIPDDADLVLDNSKDSFDLKHLANKLLEFLDISPAGYSYTSRDLISHRERYFYSQVLGPEFLTAYEDSREKALKNLERRLLRLDETYKGDPPPAPWDSITGNDYSIPAEWIRSELGTGQSIAMEGVQDTVPLLSNWLAEINESPETSGDLLPMVLDLLKRFEVSKRLYSSYRLPDMKHKNGGYGKMIHYALFSLLLQSIAEKQANERTRIILFNSVLKAGDILVSCLHRLATPCELWLTHAAISKELEQFRRLRREVLK